MSQSTRGSKSASTVTCAWLGQLPTLLALSVLLGATSASLQAADWFVPDDFASIQDAIDNAADGDTIFVRAGEYVESLTISSRSLELRALDGPAVTTLRGAGGSVVTVVQDDALGKASDLLFLIAGFTITGGTGTPDAENPELTHGGGLHLTQIQVFGLEYIRVDDCHIIDNHVTGDGGGVWMNGSATVESLGSQRNRVAHNSAGRDGGGLMYAEDTQGLAFQNSTVEHNVAARDGGGAYRTRGLDGFLANSTVRHNHALRDGGGVYLSTNMTTVEVRDNRADRDGGGIFALSHTTGLGSPNVRLVRVALRDNLAGRHGGAVAFSNEAGPNGNLVLRLSEIVDNHAAGLGGAVKLSLVPPLDSVEFLRDTFVGNTAGEGGAAVWVDATGEGVQSVQRGVITEHAAADFAGSFTATFETSIVEGGAPGIEVVDADPQFASISGRILAVLPSSPALALGSESELVGAWSAPEFYATKLGGVHGASGRPELSGAGTLVAESAFELTLEQAPPGAPAWFVTGAAATVLPFKGGVLVPEPTAIRFVGLIPADGSHEIPARWPAGAPSGAVLFTQAVVRDEAAASGFSMSDALALIGR